MKILVVDDEALTREGIISSIDWRELNIQEILRADDGVQGLHIAKKHRPDIILSDVRMPRMDGLDMAKKIYDFLPEVSIIFMSGYSDREYLKTAIKLHAVSYVEKPINILEIKDALVQAIKNNEQQKRTKRSEEIHTLEKSSRLALQITLSPEQREQIKFKEIESLNLGIKQDTLFATIIIKCHCSISDMDDEKIKGIHHQLDLYLKQWHLKQINVTKYDQYFIYHIFGNIGYNRKQLMQIGGFLKIKLEPTTDFFMAIGDVVSGIEKVYQSYHSAVFLLQSSFFHEHNSILTASPANLKFTPVFTDPTSSFEDALLSKNKKRILEATKRVYLSFSSHSTLLPSYIKDCYYKLFMMIQNTYKNLYLHLSEPSVNDSILEDVEKCHNLMELNQLLEEKIEQFLNTIEDGSPQNPTILAIKEFIRNNYSSENLSVKDISEHVYMSSSYVCTLFKNETGSTLNQYITDFRIEKAKQLLTDPNFKITDISSKVGYADGNYFGKIFKKQVGLSPSKYREKMLI